MNDDMYWNYTKEYIKSMNHSYYNPNSLDDYVASSDFAIINDEYTISLDSYSKKYDPFKIPACNIRLLVRLLQRV